MLLVGMASFSTITSSVVASIVGFTVVFELVFSVEAINLLVELATFLVAVVELGLAKKGFTAVVFGCVFWVIDNFVFGVSVFLFSTFVFLILNKLGTFSKKTFPLPQFLFPFTEVDI